MANGITGAGSSSAGIATLMNSAQEYSEFSAAMRAADTRISSESVATTLLLNTNQMRRKTLEVGTEAENQDMGRRPQAVQQLYRA